MKVNIVITSPVVVPPIVIPPPGEYFQLMWDWQTDEYGGGVRPVAPAPATMKSLVDVWVEMPEPFQRWFWEVWMIYAPDDMSLDRRKQKWDSYWHSATAWTNKGNGSDVCASYPTGKNLSARPMAREQLGCRGMNVKLRDGWTAQDKLNNMWWPFDAIQNNANLLYSPAEFARMWWLCGYATVQTNKKLADGTYQIDRFPQLDGNDVPLPLLSRDGTLWFHRNRVRPVNVRANSYNPPRQSIPNL
jgi:hypothetical protein